jgi:hypothetical protein
VTVDIVFPTFLVTVLQDLPKNQNYHKAISTSQLVAKYKKTTAG